MSAKVRDKCGVIGISSRSSDVSLSLYNALIALQHRGQESCGITVLSSGLWVPGLETRNSKLETHRGMGLVMRVFSEVDLERMKGNAGIGHVRYSTTGVSDARNAQPFFTDNIAIAYNGNLTNYKSVKRKLESKGIKFETDSDTEVILRILDNELVPPKEGGKERKAQVFSACKKLMGEIEGAYSVAAVTAQGELIALRDPFGFKPFCLGRKGDAHYVCSESAALDAVGAEFARDIKPGGAVYIDPSGKLDSAQVVASKKRAFCMFEFVYFARPDSVIEGRTVEAVRLRLGEKLAEMKKLAVDLVIPVPDSGRSAALGYHMATGIPMKEALIKNRYIHRTFIMPDHDKRKRLVGLKLNVIQSFVNGKKVALVDDSIVRGNTMKRIVELVRNAEAKEVHLLISCPPIIAPCFMGVDFPTSHELIASGNTVEQIRKELGVDSLTYLSLEKLHEAIGLKGLCDACLTKEYPIEIAK
ncbi:amidophosphoribosyltransferase [Candidatus Micrarchaeota archaeon CG08_land_8_20_14_0_20_49_17]|nr:MAG: amidophosphoribosyltransferase [Candidatus Micrarchaeota archaeon CG1_02_49_24]PIU09471.1 MAG: amidophosphoribosyltransferase [Candidatus Micrarchaeota archaeon CG08_land_8_20_14_0_20_49_17]PIU81692.1 MAG: amidophosphoribosyltransferase [Candidatus Micrarchaeota archaeon CG06_land_8_20_14_3_00_50_6]HII53894.1 amidophosphoribosyltransferase [Candidatus Micrarchaeota archaeon]